MGSICNLAPNKKNEQKSEFITDDPSSLPVEKSKSSLITRNGDELNLPANKIINLIRTNYFRKKEFVKLKDEEEFEYQNCVRTYETDNIRRIESLIETFEKPERSVSNKNLFAKLMIGQDFIYSGEIDFNYQRNGFGCLYKKGGTKLIGNWKNNNLNGVSRVINSDGILLEGEFVNNMLHGKGLRRDFTNNIIYHGDWNYNKKEGKGIEEDSNVKYEGDFRNNKRDGIGKLYFKKLQESYEGEFKDDDLTGKGIYKFNSEEIYEGYFLNGKMHGYGVYRFIDGSTYEGNYFDNLKQGEGCLTLKNGKKYKGNFENGFPHGEFLLFDDKYKEGKKVEFSMGKIVRQNPKNSKHSNSKLIKIS